MFTFKMRNFRTKAMIPVALVATIAWASPSLAEANCPETQFVESAARSFIAAAQTHNAAQFANTVSRYSDLPALALFALGQYRSELSADKKAEYFSLVRNFIGRFLADHSSEFANAQFQIQSCGGGEVRSVANGRQIVWNVSGGHIRDIQAGGFSLAVELQSKFVSVIRQGGGRIDALLSYLSQAQSR